MNHRVAQQMRQAPAVFVVGFVTLAILRLLRIGQINLEVSLPYVDSLRSRGFHHDMRDSFLFQPVAQAFQLRHNRREAPFLRARFPIQSPAMTQTASHVFPTSIPAQRSTAAPIISMPPFGQENSRHLHN